MAEINFSLFTMKKLFKGVVKFTQREWFLLIMIATITLIITLFNTL